MSQDLVAHILGRVYLCEHGHETDDVEAGPEIVGDMFLAFVNDPPDTKPCATCGKPAVLKFYGDQHSKSTPCDRPPCKPS
jgi:hypothetical protein